MSLGQGAGTPRLRRGGAALLACLAALLSLALLPSLASAASPTIGDIWASRVAARSARLSAEINPNGLPTSAYFEYATKAAHDANGFTAAKKVNLSIGEGGNVLTVNFPTIASLDPETTYVYRLTATNDSGTVVVPPPNPGPPYQHFITQGLASGQLLPDHRQWEMVSPIDKNGGQVDQPGTLASGGLLQAATQGGAVTYSSASSFSAGQGAPPASQYLATRTAEGWSTQNLTVPIFSGSYDTVNGGSPYRLFSPDLARGLLLNGKSCRGEATVGCPVPNPTLPGTDAPAGYQHYYLRDTLSAGFEALLGAGDIAALGLDPAAFELRFAAASPDLTHIVLSTCSRLTADAIDGCPAAQNLYGWSPGGAPSLINTTPGATIAAPAGALSADGARVYFYSAGDLYLGDRGTITQIDQAAGGGGAFETASADGSVAFFSKGGHLWRFSSATASATDITPGGGVAGVLAAAADGSHLYYLNGSGLWLCASADLAPDCEAASTKVAADADAGNYPPATGTSRISPDGTKLAFLATTPLTGFDNTDLITGQPDSQVYLYDEASDTLACASCNPTNGRPIGPSTIPGAIANGSGPTATTSYKPRVLTSGGRRLFFDSGDALALTDTNSLTSGVGVTDAYQWEMQGAGDCTHPAGCLALISSGRDAGGGRFIDASGDGSDAFFLTAASLFAADPGSIDLYDARVDGGFPEPADPIPCAGDACQVLPPAPTDPTLTTLLKGPGNPAVHYTRYRHRFKKRGKPKGRSHHHRGHR